MPAEAATIRSKQTLAIIIIINWRSFVTNKIVFLALFGRTRVFDAGGQAIGDAKALFDLAQHQNAAVRRQQTTVEIDDNGLAGDR
jgi:hypothetical protein